MLKMIFWNNFSFLFLILCNRLIVVDLIPEEDITVREGEPVSLLCQYQGAQMSWRYYSNQYDNIGDYISGGLHVDESFRGQFAVYYNQTEGIYGLNIERPKLSNTGYYKCAYLNNLVSLSILRVVSVYAPWCVTYFLDIAQQQVEFAQVNDNILLSCNSGFNSNYPKIRWLRGSNYTKFGEIDQRNILQVPLILRQEDEDVIFTCVLGEGDIRSAPSCSLTPFPSQPEVSIVPTVAHAMEGENVAFECSGRVNSGNITYDWDETTFTRFAGRYALNADRTRLQISGLKASDNATNVTCLVTVNTGTRGSSVAILHVTKENIASNGNLNRGTEESGGGRAETGGGSGGSTGIMVGVISVSAIAILLVIAVILIISRRKKNQNHPALSSPRIKSANFDEGVLRNTSQYYDDSEQYAVTGPPMINGTAKNDQVAFFSEGRRSSVVQVTYAVAGQHEISGDEEGAMTAYDQVDRSKTMQQAGEASYIPEYHVIENSNDSALPVYAEVNKGSTEHLHLPSENVGSLNEDGTYEMYAEVNKHDSMLTKPANQTVTGAKKTEKPNYAQVNKKVKDDLEEFDDGYAKPNFSASDENTTCDEGEDNLPLATSPLYSEVQKSDLTGDESDATKQGKGKEKPKYAKVNKKPKVQLMSETEA